MYVTVVQKAESDIEGENSNDGEEAAVGALESLALGHHHQHMKGRGVHAALANVQQGELKLTDLTLSSVHAESLYHFLRTRLASPGYHGAFLVWNAGTIQPISDR